MAAKGSKNRGSDQDAARLDEVEAGLDDTNSVPDDIAAEVADLKITEEKQLTATRVKNVWIQVKTREAAWIRAKERAEATEKALQADRDALTADRQALVERAERIAEREMATARAEADLEIQRSAARAGFADDLKELTRAAVQHRDELLAESLHIAEEARKRAAEVLSAAHEETHAERERLVALTEELATRETNLRRREAKVEADLEFAEVKNAMLTGQQVRQLEVQIADEREQVADLRDDLEAERQRRRARDERIRELQAELAHYGDDPDALIRQRDELVAQVTKLRDEMSRRPPEAEIAELRARATQVTEAESQAAYWRQQHDAIDQRLRYQLMSVGELEVLRDERDTLAAQRETLRQAIEQQRAQWAELQAKEATKEPFPACSAYDRDSALNRPTATHPVDSLADLVTEVRSRMASGDPAFYYEETDVRLFLAGLASSRLHLLQGISGTGKTSLPREFFKALSGAGAAQIVEVQAGWRDKDDLFGYYNAFEKRFAESEFTKALYRALLPANADRPMVIVLDEMNLAHPEQYFGSMLSILENAVVEKGYLDLLTSALPGLPAKFEGARLPLPRNVWFVGTANHDETTVAFADKTYDRAHVQELPARHKEFPAQHSGSVRPVSFSALQRSFDAAAREFRGVVDEVKSFLDENLHDNFAKLGVGWGNRLERQLESFVPVVLGAGGTTTEAVDHLVATKLVRKLEDRFGVRPEELNRLAEEIELSWDLDGGPPARTLTRIRREASRLLRGYGS
ncbi:AAA domain (dynein-related subfamily) [Lentzea albidocapillata subsp. violacea]|uniref:AAA domain (Dynein-related subfamily) n=1 Tax=Lentzea albidocapillata subsp. violacea TaxID=128104 RepID=A0A1G9X5P7_9PSEU|nr:AAA domain (dynein-related subfamily) [Lentzea albidocapillata subsp. violacea]